MHCLQPARARPLSANMAYMASGDCLQPLRSRSAVWSSASPEPCLITHCRLLSKGQAMARASYCWACPAGRHRPEIQRLGGEAGCGRAKNHL